MAPSAGEALGLRALNDDLLIAILILLPTLADLGRACASLPEFRRLITAPSFLRRLRTLHPPSLLGFRISYGSFQPVTEPPGTARALALPGVADFHFTFLPNPGTWLVRDARDGRFVLDRKVAGASTQIAVCDPLFRRFVLLPPIPEDLADGVQLRQVLWTKRIYAYSYCSCNTESKRKHTYDVFLVPSGDDDEPQSFRVVWMAQCTDKLLVLVFSSTSSQWRALPSLCWRDLDPSMPASVKWQPLLYRSYAYGCFYWVLTDYHHCSKLIMLDMSSMEFSHVYPQLPFSYNFEKIAIVELGAGRRGMFKIGKFERSIQLLSAERQNHLGVASSQWVLENEVSLYHSLLYDILGACDASAKLFLLGKRKIYTGDRDEGSACCITVDFKTMRLQMVRKWLSGSACQFNKPALYTGYPPSLSSPTV